MKIIFNMKGAVSLRGLFFSSLRDRKNKMMENSKQIILDLLSKTNSAIDIKKITDLYASYLRI